MNRWLSQHLHSGQDALHQFRIIVSRLEQWCLQSIDRCRIKTKPHLILHILHDSSLGDQASKLISLKGCGFHAGCLRKYYVKNIQSCASALRYTTTMTNSGCRSDLLPNIRQLIPHLLMQALGCLWYAFHKKLTVQKQKCYIAITFIGAQILQISFTILLFTAVHFHFLHQLDI